MEIHYSFSIADGTFKQKFSTIKNYTWAKVWNHTHVHVHFVSHDVILWLLSTQRFFKNICPKDAAEHLEKISTLFAVIALYSCFCPSNCSAQPCWQKAEPGSPGAGNWKNPPYWTLYIPPCLLYICQKSQRSELDTGQALPSTSLDNSYTNHFQNNHQNYWKQHVLRGS